MQYKNHHTIVGIVNIVDIFPVVASNHVSYGVGMGRTHIQVVAVDVPRGLVFHIVCDVRHVEGSGEGVDNIERSGIDTSQYHKHAIRHMITDWKID